MFSSAAAPKTKDVELSQPPPESVSKIAFSPTQDILAVASWDNNVCNISSRRLYGYLMGQVRLYNVNAQGQSEPKAMYSHQGPVLDLCWSKVSGLQIFKQVN
jgi:mRNA export factor